MLNSYLRDRILNPQLTTIKNSYNKENVYEVLFVHAYVTYENVIWPNLCYTQKYDI